MVLSKQEVFREYSSTLQRFSEIFGGKELDQSVYFPKAPKKEASIRSFDY